MEALLRYFLFLASFLITSPAFSAKQQEGPLAVAKIFCSHQLAIDERNQITPYYAHLDKILTPDLSRLIAKAHDKTDEFVKANPQQKPPLGDGIPFMSVQDYPTTCTTWVTQLKQNSALLAVRYTFGEQDAHDVTNHLRIRKIGGSWKIDDVIYQPYSLRASLKAAIDVGAGSP